MLRFGKTEAIAGQTLRYRQQIRYSCATTQHSKLYCMRMKTQDMVRELLEVTDRFNKTASPQIDRDRISHATNIIHLASKIFADSTWVVNYNTSNFTWDISPK